MASGIVAAADKYGFIMIFPQTTNPATSAKCWDVGSKASLTHDGGGDTQAIAQMVKYEITKRSANANRVYIMGASSGAMLTEAMLAVYPDVFKAGSEFSGVPAGCWSSGWSAASNWGGTCANGSDIKTAQQWGDLVRGMYSGYSGYRPRVQLWHGTADGTIKYQNQLEGIKEWTNVLGLNTTPDSTDSTSVSGYKIEKWKSSTCGGFVMLEAHTQSNGGHTTPIDANSVISWFGLDKTGTDPQVAACSGAGGSPGTGGTTGAGGTTMGTGGAQTGGTSSSGGTHATTGGTSSTGGRSNNGSTVVTGGTVGVGGSVATGGKSSTVAIGGKSSTSGTFATGGIIGNGGSLSNTGGTALGTGGNWGTIGATTPISGGSSALANGGSIVGGNPNVVGGNSATSGTNETDPEEGGCSCNVPGKKPSIGLFALALGAVLALQRRRKR
jgi:poly(hydroxyalkanoate) depolymerase family esterase